MNKIVGISKSNSKYKKYTDWLHDSGMQYITLDWEQNNFDDIKKCSALILTGGCDIFPEFYADWEDGKNRDDYIPERDGFEFRLFDHALENKLPVLAICRGMQLVNCKMNGSLISDIETSRGTNHRKISDTEDKYHEVNIREGTLLQEIIANNSGIINSSHHQAIDRPGEGLLISARSTDGIIEGIEWDEKEGKSFFLGIQWHPERMKDKQSPFTKKIIDRFKEEINKL